MSIEGLKLRALDLSMGWAGPLVTEMLAEMGVEIIKVEDTRRFDWWRGSLSMAPPEMQPVERSSVFNTANRGKLGITLDLGDPRGAAILDKLVAVSDVLAENFSPGVMERLGLSYARLRARNPRLIMLSMPAFASDGPEAGHRGYGMTIEGMAGVTDLCRYHDSDRPYTLSNALGDPVSGLHGTLAVLAALRERRRTGVGQWVEVAEVETVVPFVAEALLDCQLSGSVRAPVGNRDRCKAPHGVYRCRGEDSWIALGIEREAQWPELLHALGLEHLRGDARFAEMAARKRNEDALDAEIGRAAAGASAEELARRLEAAGIAAAPVQSPPAVLADQQLLSRGFFVPIERKAAGTHLYPGPVARLSATPLRADSPAPLLGEHNDYVLGRLAGLGEAELRELERAGVIGWQPRES